MKEYQRKGILAKAILSDTSYIDPEYVQEFELEIKTSRVLRDRNQKHNANQRDKRRNHYDLDD